jgi:hypothetical protein
MQGEGHGGVGGVMSVRNPYLRCQQPASKAEMTALPNTSHQEQRRITINPYIRYTINSSSNNNSLVTMPQSQWRKSSILHCKQKVSLFRGPRTYPNRSENVPRACRVCKVKEHNNLLQQQIQEAKMAKASLIEIKKLESNLKNIPHRAHIKGCPGNNNTKRRHHVQSTSNTTRSPSPVTGTTINNITRHMLSPQQRSLTIDLVHLERWKMTPLATELRTVLQERTQNSEYMAKLKACRAPTALAVLVDYIDSTFFCRRPKDHNLPASDNFVEKYDQYRRFFKAGSIAFVFPAERRDWSPYPPYHAIEGACPIPVVNY